MGQLTRRRFLQGASAVGGGLALGSMLRPEARGEEGDAKPKKRPNLLFVFSDQQSSDMLGCYGNESIRTPRLDRFAGEGVRFNHCISNSPVCTPHRGSLLSGLHPLYHGAFFNDIQMLPGDGKYFGEVLRDAGYRMGYVGKWHLYGGERVRPVPAGPLRYGFDDYFLTNNCTLEFAAGKSWYWDHDNQRAIYDRWEPDAQTDQAIEFLHQSATSDEPWALFVSWHPPHNWGGHWGYAAPGEDRKRYAPNQIKLRPGMEDTKKNRKMLCDYFALCSNLDDNFGRLRDTLEKQGSLDDTIIVYTSDHGDCLRVKGRFDLHKRRPEAESVRVPLMIRAPGLAKRQSDLLFSTFDLMPTILGLLGIAPPRSCQGMDMAAAIRKGDDDARDSVPLFLSCFDNIDWRGLYTRRHTYSFGPDGNRFNRLYDRQADPHEQNNLFGQPSRKAVQEKLHRETLKWMDRFDDPFVPYPILLQAAAKEPTKNGIMYKASDGALKGRPVEFAKKLAKKGFAL